MLIRVLQDRIVALIKAFLFCFPLSQNQCWEVCPHSQACLYLWRPARCGEPLNPYVIHPRKIPSSITGLWGNSFDDVLVNSLFLSGV